MPAKSRKQYRFMKAVESGAIKADGLSKSEAAEYTSHNDSYKALPESKSNARKVALKKLSKGY